MLKIEKLPIIASYIYLQFDLKITSRGQKYGGFFFAQLFKNATDCFVLEILTADRVDFKIDSVSLKARRKKIQFYNSLRNGSNYSHTVDSR